MATPGVPVEIFNEGPSPAPLSFTVASGQVVQPASIFATFDGTAAASPFLACVTIRSKTGDILSRVFPSTPVAAGGVADVSYAPFPGGLIQPPSAGGGDYVFLDEQSPNGITSVIRFANIPGIYRHLRLELALQRTVAGGVATVPIRWNAAGSYSSAFIYYPSGGTIHRCRQSGDGDGVYLNFGHVDGAAGTSRAYELPNPGGGDFATFVIEFPFYSKADRAHKLVWQGASGLGNALLHTTGSGTDDGLNPPAPITQIDILAQVGVLAPGSVGTLYGVK